MRVGATLILLAVIAIGCSAPSSKSREPALSGTATVFAASSLTDAFRRAGDEFTRINPSAAVTFNFASSSTLATQIANGAPADVFASADEANMQKLIDADQVDGAPVVFAANRLQIAVGAGNPRGITGLADLARSDLVVVLAAPSVPAGRYAGESLAKAGVTVRPRSLEVDVRAVLSKVALGEADAGLVYVTDVLAGGPRVSGVAIPEQHQVVARYPLAIVKNAPSRALAASFIAFIRSEPGQRILRELGFSAP